MVETTGDVLTIEELSAYLKIPKSTLYKLVREGKIPSHLENGRLLVSSTLPRSYRSDSKVNSTSISSRLCWT